MADVALLAQLSRLEAEVRSTEKEHDAINQKHTDKFNHLVQTADMAENKVYENKKILITLDAEIELITGNIDEILARRNFINSENGKLEKDIKKYRKKRIAAERDLESQFAPLKERRGVITGDIQRLKEKLRQTQKDIQAASTPTDEADSRNPFLDHLTDQIKSKEDDLECPVCLETCATPIYMCQNQHIICSYCLKKVQNMKTVKDCAICRTPYPNNPERHRYKEKVATELLEMKALKEGLEANWE